MRPGTNDTHSKLIGYILWIFGFTGAHRFYYGKVKTGIFWFFAGWIWLVMALLVFFGPVGIVAWLGMGAVLVCFWLLDLFLIPAMDREADRRFVTGPNDYTVAWILLGFLGFFGAHRFYLGKWGTGLIYLFSGGLLGIGWLYDLCTLNRQVDEMNRAGF